SRTVVDPLKAIVAALGGAARGERVALRLPHAHKGDEIAQLVEVLHVLEHHMEAMRESSARLDAGERRLRAVVDNAVDGLITINEKGDIESFNPASERIFGYAAGEIIGAHASEIMPALFDGACDSANEPRADNTQSFTAAAALETRGRRRDGRIVPIEI